MKTKKKISKIKKMLLSTLVMTCLTFTLMAQSEADYGLEGYRENLSGVNEVTNSQKEPAEISKLNVYFSSGECKVRFEKPSNENVYIKIYDISGKLIMSDAALSSEILIERVYNLMGVCSGIYIVNVYSDKKVVTKKIFI